ncbi:hypothetical protein chiPu_0025564, partial [Chiloscyllium punctatum]|nr:hypothetical protein [Chiloscyllium punctatum]
MAEHGDLLLSVLSGVRVPRPGDRVHKDECAFSFDTPVSGSFPPPTFFFGRPSTARSAGGDAVRRPG